MGVQVHEDNGDHYIVSHRGGAKFKIGKSNLKPKDEEKLKAHLAAGAMQHFDAGGAVQEGGTDDPTSDQQIYLDSQSDSLVNRLKSADMMADRQRLAPLLSYESQIRTPQDRDTPPSVESDELAREASALKLPVTVGYGPAPTQPSSSSPQVDQPPQLEQPPAQTTPTEGPIQQASFPSPLPPPSARGSGPPAPNELDQGIKLQTDAANATAKAAEDKANMDAATMQADQQERAGLHQQWNDRWEANQRRQDEISDKIASSQIDPNRMWNSKTGWEKAKSTIGLILGGIGSGLTGGPNVAVQMLHNDAERDVDAQKANLGKLHTQFSNYVQQGHSIEDAQKLAMADQMDVQRGHLALNSTKIACPEARANAAALTGQLKTNAFKLRQEAYSRTLENEDKKLDIEQKKRGLMLQPLQQAALNGAVLPEQYRAYLPPDKIVPVPGGGVTLANTPKDRDEVADTNQALQSGLSATRKYEQLAKKVGMGGSTTHEGQLAVTELQNAYQSILGRSNAPRGKQEEELSSMLGNPTNLWRTSGGAKDLMTQMRSILRKHATSVYSTRLAGGLKAAQGFIPAEGK